MPTSDKAAERGVFENPFFRDCARSRTSTKTSMSFLKSVSRKSLKFEPSYPIVCSMLPPIFFRESRMGRQGYRSARR